jgi:membrane-associated phospholipid phosphatase
MVIICYFWVDKPVVYFTYSHHLQDYRVFYWIQLIPEAFWVLTPIIYVVLLIRWHFGYGDYHDKFALTLISALLITVAFEDQLKFVFGRYWPDTYVENNLSLLKDNAYGFNWFHAGKGFRSFPSGHSATIFATMTVVWRFYPRLRWLAVVLCSLVIIGLTGMRYHFISDMIAGACVGIIIGDSISRISLDYRRSS